MRELPIGVLGAGSWGTALAVLLAGNGHPVLLWGNEPEHVQALQRQRQNPAYLPGIDFPEPLRPEPDLEAVVAASETLLVVIPSQGFRQLLERIAPLLRERHRLAWASKGLEPGVARPLHEVAEQILGVERPLALVSGPTFAMEVARGLPTAVTVASRRVDFARELALVLHNHHFRVYVSEDIAGVGIGGALKNVYAIAAGVADGLGFGANTRAALITRALAEITRLGVAAGGQVETFMGLAGLGDLLLTCTDDQSRNRRMGLALATGMGCDAARRTIDQVVEGIGTAREARRLAQELGVELPICNEVYRVLFEGLEPGQAVRNLLDREDTRGEIV